ncbi:MAG: acetate--CoA ligase family protein [Acidobacteria bacterium]|jgi:acetyl coenzyme A synthetase (ADP forming)-like protein|nr:acetate--CoA ligase family protein [Acidobacteriota bacterium]
MSTALDALFRPRSVAVVGASRDRTSISADILHNLLRYEFQGLVFPVNPRASVIHSIKCYPTVEDIPDEVDLAIIAAPRAFVAAQVESCGRKGVKGIVVITAGFKEVGDEGAVFEAEVREIVRRYGMRMIGPNCMGLINTDPDYRLQGTFSATTEPLAGNIAFSSQSGALGEAILALMSQLGLGLSMFASLGNKADVSGNDLLEYWEDDPRTRVVLMYLESFGNPQRFLQIARRVASKKPILAMKSGRTAAGARAAVSHTGSLAGTDAAVDTLFQQSGVIRCNSIEEMFVYASALATQPIPKGDRVAIVTNSGGPGILATDTLVQLGLTVAPLSAATQARMRPHIAPEASTVNPVDMIASARGPQYEACMSAVIEDPDVDAVIAIFTSLESIDSMAVANGIIRGAGHGKPVLVCFMGKVSAKPAVAHMKACGLPVYTFPEEAAHAMWALVRYRQWLERPEGRVIAFDDIDRAAIDRLIGGARGEGRKMLTLAEAQRLFEACGIHVAPWREAASDLEAVEAADTVGYPVALKVSSAVITHKSDTGGVKLSLGDPDAVARAAAEVLARARDTDPAATLVIQRMAPKGTEVIIGATRDPKFGPLIMFGLGGIFVEVLEDVAFRLQPLTDIDAAEMLDEIKGAPLLDGARGHAPADRATLRDVLLRINALLTMYPEIEEVDMNPFMAGPTPGASMAVDARVRIHR